MEKNIEIVQDEAGRNVVIIHNIRFKGKQHIDWKDVETYLKKYVDWLTKCL